MDCSRDFGNESCNGGLPANSYEYLKTTKLETESAYPYLMIDSTCHHDAKAGVTGITGYTQISDQNPLTLLTAASKQTISLSIDATMLKSYAGGVLASDDCYHNLNHSVLIVGYGHDEIANLDYWLLKNSWGTSWGEEGFFRLKRDMNTIGPGMCGLQIRPVYPTMD